MFQAGMVCWLRIKKTKPLPARLMTRALTIADVLFNYFFFLAPLFF
jgi:hypothetical protein